MQAARPARDVFDACLPIASGKGVELQLDLDPDATITADENMLKTILRNLVINAIKFTRGGGTVSIGAHAEGDRITYSVRDTASE